MARAEHATALAAAVAAATAEAAEEQARRDEALNTIAADVASLEAAMASDRVLDGQSRNVLRLWLAWTAMADALSEDRPRRSFAAEARALRDAGDAADDAVVAAALDAVPEDVLADNVPTLAELRNRFGRVRTAAYRAQFVPDDRDDVPAQLTAYYLAWCARWRRKRGHVLTD